MDTIVFATIMWLFAIVTAFFTGRALGQHEEKMRTEFLRDRVNTLSARLDLLEEGKK